MDFLEKDLEQIIYEATEEQLNEFDFPTGIKKRQLRIGNYGIADLVYFKRVAVTSFRPDDGKPVCDVVDNSGLCITVCEFKKDKIGISAFLQAINYCKGISRYLLKRGFESFYFNILLVGRNIDDSGSFVYLTDLLGESLRYSYDNVDGEENYNAYTSYFNQGINNIKFKTSSYDFNGIKFKDHKGYKLKNEGF